MRFSVFSMIQYTIPAYSAPTVYNTIHTSWHNIDYQTAIYGRMHKNAHKSAKIGSYAPNVWKNAHFGYARRSRANKPNFFTEWRSFWRFWHKNCKGGSSIKKFDSTIKNFDSAIKRFAVGKRNGDDFCQPMPIFVTRPMCPGFWYTFVAKMRFFRLWKWSKSLKKTPKTIIGRAKSYSCIDDLASLGYPVIPLYGKKLVIWEKFINGDLFGFGKMAHRWFPYGRSDLLEMRFHQNLLLSSAWEDHVFRPEFRLHWMVSYGLYSRILDIARFLGVWVLGLIWRNLHRHDPVSTW